MSATGGGQNKSGQGCRASRVSELTCGTPSPQTLWASERGVLRWGAVLGFINAGVLGGFFCSRKHKPADADTDAEAGGWLPPSSLSPSLSPTPPPLPAHTESARRLGEKKWEEKEEAGRERWGSLSRTLSLFFPCFRFFSVFFLFRFCLLFFLFFFFLFSSPEGMMGGILN